MNISSCSRKWFDQNVFVGFNITFCDLIVCHLRYVSLVLVGMYCLKGNLYSPLCSLYTVMSNQLYCTPSPHLVCMIWNYTSVKIARSNNEKYFKTCSNKINSLNVIGEGTETTAFLFRLCFCKTIKTFESKVALRMQLIFTPWKCTEIAKNVFRFKNLW